MLYSREDVWMIAIGGLLLGLSIGYIVGGMTEYLRKR
jgi:NhaP-type Na+/H+ or K+/H+ antiporter